MPTPYRLFLDEAEWRDLPRRLEDPVHAAIAATNREALDLLHAIPPDAPKIPRNLSQSDSEPIHLSYRIHKIRFSRGAVGWYLDRDQREAEDLRRAVDVYLGLRFERPDDGGKGGLRHFDLRSGDLCWCAAFALDALAGVLGEDRVAALVAVLAERLLPAYLRGIAEGDWWRACDFNWGAACHGNAALAALAIEEDHPELAAEVLAAAEHGLGPVLQAMPAGGAWIEGMMYQSTTIGHLTDFLAAWERVRGVEHRFATEPRLHDCVRYRREQMGGDDRPLNFSNCMEGTIECFLPHVWWWARKLDDPSLTQFEDTHIKPWWDMHGIYHDVEGFWFRAAGQPAVARSPRACHRFDGLGWVSFRKDRWWGAIRGGQLGGNHGNLDLGQVIVGSGAHRWLVDPGYGASKTDQHNLPTIRSKDQTDAASAHLVRAVEEPDLHLAYDLKQAHPWVLDRWIRHLLVLDGRAVVLIDDLLGQGARRLSAGFHLQLRGEVQVDDERATVRQDGATLHLGAPGPHFGLDLEPWSFGGRDIVKLSWRQRPDLPAMVQAVTLSEDPEPIVVTHRDGESEIVLGSQRWRLDRVEHHLRRL